MPKVAILRGVSFGKHRRKAKKTRAKKTHKRSGGRAAQRARFKAAANACKVEVVAEIRRTKGPANPFKMTGRCMARHLRKRK